MIPKIIHFVFGMAPDFGNIPFSLPHYLAIKSAYEVNKPDKMFVHLTHEPVNNKYWEKARPYIKIIPTVTPKQICGNKIYKYAHAADVIRLQMLNAVGGIYLDLDTICITPFNDLLNNKFVMGKQGSLGICNAVMLAEQGSEFGKLWYDMFYSFEGKIGWDEHAVQVPHSLSLVRPDLITILEEEAMFIPSYLQLDLLYEKNIDLTGKYVLHLWEHLSWGKYLSKIDEQWIWDNECSYSTVARKFL